MLYQQITMSNPIHQSLRNSPSKQLSSPSPTKNQSDFLIRKISILEQDYRQVCDQLQKVRNRLRKAQDFQIKYDLLVKQKALIQSQIRSKDTLLQEYQNQIKQLQVNCQDAKNSELTFKFEKDNIMREGQQWRLKYFQAQQIASKIRAQQQYKMNQKLISQLQVLKKHFSNQQEQYKNRIRILEINLAEKDTVENALKDKNSKNNLDKDNQIQRLQTNLTKLRQQHIQYAEQKNKELVSVANKFQTIFNYEIQKLKSHQNQNSQKFSIQVEGLRGLIQLKNNQINELIKQSKESRERFLAEKNQLLTEISLLREKIFQRQRQNQLQFYNLKERLIALHKADTQSMKQNFETINLNLEQNIKELENLIKKKDKQNFELNEKFQEKKNQLLLTIQQKNLAISQLQDQIRHAGDMNAKQIDKLHSSFHKITTDKGLLSTQYQSTFNFLNNQISKLTHSNELKNQEIKDLHLENAQTKKNFSQHIKQLQRKWRLQRKQRQEQRDKQRDLREKLEDQFREKQQKWRHRQRMLERDKQKQQREKTKQKVTIQELEKNLQRLTKHVRQNQGRLKQQMQKNQTNFVESSTIRRQLTGQLQRQKTQLQSMKKMEFDQVHRQYEIQIQRLSNQNQKLLNELNDLRLNFDKLQEQYKKVKNTNKNIDRINKQKLIDYERKMAALNAQINLTQNLYNSFISAKSKVVKKGQQN